MIPDATPKEVANLKDFLRRENAEYQDRCARRPVYAKIAKGYGFTNQEIADEYGITEAAVRGLIKRASK